jgi:hypothetical protein
MPSGEQRVLDVMESELEGGEPRLGSMFAIFTRLTRDDGAPRTESLWSEPRRIWPASRLPGTLRAIIAVPLVLGLVALLIFMAVSGSAQGCQPGWAPHGTTMTRVTVCQSAGEPQGHS